MGSIVQADGGPGGGMTRRSRVNCAQQGRPLKSSLFSRRPPSVTTEETLLGLTRSTQWGHSSSD